MQRGRATNCSTRNLRATRGGAHGGMARQMEILGIPLPEATGALRILPAVPTPTIVPGVPSKPNRGLIRVVTETELAEGSLKRTLGALSLSTDPSGSTSSSKGSSGPDRPIDDTLRTKDPAVSTPAPIKVSSVKELLDLVFAEEFADIESMTISMVLKDGSKLEFNAKM